MFTDPAKAAAVTADAAPAPATVRKFMFDRSFDQNAAPKPVERKPVLMKPEQLDELRREAFEAGSAAGRKSAADEQDQRVLAMVTQLDQHVAQAINQMEPLHRQMDGQLRELVLAIAGRILPAFSAKHGLGEIQAMLAGAIADMVHEPRLVVRIHETQFDEVNARIQEITVQKAYAGKVVVLADTEMALGDCRVEWADGGIERKTDATWQDIRHIIAPEPDADTSARL